jgi:tRNA (cmo5U34)-methyltransferase
MSDTAETNAAIWKSEQGISDWIATAEDRERQRARPRRLMAELLAFDDRDAFTFVDLGAGTGAAAQAVLDRYPASRAVLADYSPQMVEEGRRVLAPYEGRYRYIEIDLAAGHWPAELAEGLDAVISSLCVHHLPDERKEQLFAEILQRLAPGAWFFNYDPVAATEPSVEALWQRVVDARDPVAVANKRAHRSPDEQARWENHVRHIVPVDLQVGFLQSAGFDAIDVYWKELDHVIYGGRRPPG